MIFFRPTKYLLKYNTVFMKKFIVTEEEKLRILNLHESLKESIFNPTKSTLNENVGPGLLRLLLGFKTTIKGSASVMSNLDDLARSFRNQGKIYNGNMRNGQDLLDLFLGGRLSNNGPGDDMAVTLLTIFRSADDTQLIRSLAKEMVDGDVLLRQGLLDGSINAVTVFGTKQGDELMDYAYRAYGRPTPFDPGGQYNQFTGIGNWNTNIVQGVGRLPEIAPDYVVRNLTARYAGNAKAQKYLTGAKKDIEQFIPQSRQQAEDIVRKQEGLIDAYLEKKGLREQFRDEFKKQLVNNWATKGAILFFIVTGVSFVFLVVMEITGFTGLTPLRNVALGLGLKDEYEAAKAAICKSGLDWACKDEGEAPPPADFGDMN